MGFLQKWLVGSETKKRTTIEEVRERIAAANGGNAYDPDRDYLQVSAVLACARVIAEGLAQVPCKLMRDAPDGNGKEEARDHPLFELLYASPNDFQTSYEFREMVGLHAVLTGNAYVFVNRDSSGRAIELLPYPSNAIRVDREGWTTRYVTTKGAVIPARNMWHIKGPSLDGYLGLDAVKNARAAIGLAMAAQSFGEQLFKNGAMPGGLLTTDQDMTPEEMTTLRDQWVAAMSNQNQLSTAVLSSGMRYEQLSVSPNNAQFLETRKLQVEEICRHFRVNPIKIFHFDNATSYSSLEQTAMAHLSDTLAPWFERFEQSARKALLSDSERTNGYQVKLNTRGLMKASASERATYYSTMRASGVMTINECRAAEDMPLIDDPIADQLKPAANLFGNPKQGDSGDNTNA